MREEANLDYIENISRGDEGFRNRFISILKEEFPNEKKLYEKYIAEESYRHAYETVHKIKHKINVLGLAEGHALATKHEAELQDGLRSLSGEFQEVLNHIALYLKTI